MRHPKSTPFSSPVFPLSPTNSGPRLGLGPSYVRSPSVQEWLLEQGLALQCQRAKRSLVVGASKCSGTEVVSRRASRFAGR